MTKNFQEVFLNVLRREKMDVTVYLTNGFQFKGQLKSFDNFTLLLESEGKQQLVFKHAISTIVPRHNVNYLKELNE